MIKIETHKAIGPHHEKGFFIDKITALFKFELPEKYAKGRIAKCWTRREIMTQHSIITLIITHKNGKKMSLQEGQLYVPKEFQKRIDLIKEAGENLKKINEERKKLECKWNGEITINI